MDFAAFLHALETSGPANTIRASLLLFPMLEAVHVMGLAVVFGTITVVDLRLLGVASGHRPFNRVASDTLKWTWIAFILVALTGAAMFITNAPGYAANFYFRTKMVLLALAGFNMLAFHLIASKTSHRWDSDPAAPLYGKTLAALSIALWISIIFMGRMIGFTTTGAAVKAPPPADVDFDDFLSAGPANSAGPPPPSTPGK
ncbi:MAG: DUF6644 family protein [Caulobacteraceae bacterium]